MAVGGLAGKLWGSTGPLHDLDFDVPTAQLPQIASCGRYVDDEFDIASNKTVIGRAAVLADLARLRA